jgi:hypothetical protein
VGIVEILSELQRSHGAEILDRPLAGTKES